MGAFLLITLFYLAQVALNNLNFWAHAALSVAVRAYSASDVSDLRLPRFSTLSYRSLLVFIVSCLPTVSHSTINNYIVQNREAEMLSPRILRLTRCLTIGEIFLTITLARIRFAHKHAAAIVRKASRLSLAPRITREISGHLTRGGVGLRLDKPPVRKRGIRRGCMGRNSQHPKEYLRVLRGKIA